MAILVSTTVVRKPSCHAMGKNSLFGLDNCNAWNSDLVWWNFQIRNGPLTVPSNKSPQCIVKYIHISKGPFSSMCIHNFLYNANHILPPRQIKSTVRLCRRVKNRRRQIQTFDLHNNWSTSSLTKKYPVWLWRRIKNRRRQIQTFNLHNN